MKTHDELAAPEIISGTIGERERDEIERNAETRREVTHDLRDKLESGHQATVQRVLDGLERLQPGLQINVVPNAITMDTLIILPLGFQIRISTKQVNDHTHAKVKFRHLVLMRPKPDMEWVHAGDGTAINVFLQ